MLLNASFAVTTTLKGVPEVVSAGREDKRRLETAPGVTLIELEVAFREPSEAPRILGPAAFSVKLKAFVPLTRVELAGSVAWASLEVKLT